MSEVLVRDDDVSAEFAASRGLSWPRVLALLAAASFVVAILAYRAGEPDAPELSEVDVGFLADMTTHHSGAIALSFDYLAHQNDSVVTQIAEEIVRSQSRSVS